MLSLANQPLPITGAVSPTEVFAAEQLSLYLAIVTGNRFPLTATPPPGPVITLRTDLIAPNPGSYRIAASETGITLAGDSGLALLHAVYAFLETRCGCRWLSEWDGGEIIPRHTELTVAACDEIVAPAFTNRVFTNYPDINADTVTMVDWMVKNRFNRFMVFANMEGAFDAYRRYLRDEAVLRGLKLEMGHHSFRFWVPPGEFFAGNPDYYALLDGERAADGQLCTSHPDLPGLVAERIATFFDANPEFDRVGLWPNDDFRWCECEACRALEPQAPSAVYPDHARRTDTYIRFVNAVAERLAASHPDKRLSALAYINYVEPPTLDVAANVDVCYAPMQRCFKHPFDGRPPARGTTKPARGTGASTAGDGEAPASPECTRPNARYAAYFDGWRQRVRGDLYLFEYTMLIDMCSLPFPLTDMYPDNWAWLAAHGCDGYVMEYKPEEWGTYGLNAYLLGRYAWEPGLDQEAFLAQHRDDLYGPAAAEMAAFHEAFVRDYVRPGPCVHHYDLTYTRRATEPLLRPALEHLGRARLLAAKGEKRHWRAVEQARLGVELLLRFGEWQRAVRDAEAAPEGTGKRTVLEGDARQAAAALLAFARDHATSGTLDLARLEMVVGQAP